MQQPRWRGESIMKRQNKIPLRCIRLVLIWSLCVFAVEAQNPENFREEAVSLVQKLRPDIKISRSTNFPLEILADSARNIRITLFSDGSKLIDARLSIFPEKIFQFYDQRILAFIERELLLVYLKKGKSVPVEGIEYKTGGKTATAHTLYEKIKSGKFNLLTSIDMRMLTNGKKNFYTARLSFDKEIFEISFPARVDLILGSSWESLADELVLFLQNAKSDTVTKFVYTPDSEKTIVPAHRQGLWMETLDSSFIAGDSRFYYSKDFSGFYPVSPEKEPVEHLNNALISADYSILKDVKVETKIKKYGQKFDTSVFGLYDIISALSQNRPVYLAFEETKGRKIVDIFFPDKGLNCFHLFYFEVDEFSAIKLQNKTLKGWLYPYIRLDNLHDIDKEFDGNGKPKWKVPIGN